MITDTGYQGIQKIHNNSELPKKSKKNTLTKNDKKNNRRLAGERVVNENVIGRNMVIRFSMSDEALKSYFAESQKAGAQLVMRVLINNSFIQTKNKTMELGISFDIDPSLFEEKYKIDVVPVIVIDDEKRGLTKKLTGHIPLSTALEIMNENTP